jgi:hypothetical protein
LRFLKRIVRCLTGDRAFLDAIKIRILCYLFLPILTSCSNMYEGFKASELDECYRLSYPDQEECLRENEVSYEEYQLYRRKGNFQ